MMAGALCEKDDFMKIMKWQKKLAVVLVGGLMVLALNAPAQNSPTAAPKLSYGVSEVVRLAQANINDDTIIAYIKSTRTDYKLSADQMFYLRQQGVSEAVIKAMLVQPKPVAAPATTPAAVASTAPAPAAPVPEATGRAAMSPTYTTPAPQPAPAVPNAVVVAPPVTYVQPAPAPYYYYPPYYYAPYPYYGWGFPPVALSFGWGWHGGYRR
jgi:hypothetical protein